MAVFLKKWQARAVVNIAGRAPGAGERIALEYGHTIKVDATGAVAAVKVVILFNT